MRTTRTTPFLTALSLALSLVVGACATSPPSPSPAALTSPSPTAVPTPAPSPSPSPTPISSPTPTPSAKPTPKPTSSPPAQASCVDRTLDAMTEAQRIGQLFMVGLAKDRLDDA